MKALVPILEQSKIVRAALVALAVTVLALGASSLARGAESRVEARCSGGPVGRDSSTTNDAAHPGLAGALTVLAQVQRTVAWAGFSGTGPGPTGLRTSSGSRHVQPQSGPQPSLSIGDATVAEGSGGTTRASFPVRMSAPSDHPVSVAYGIQDGAAGPDDYRVVAGGVTFAPGETERPVVVTVRSDQIPEPDETFRVVLGYAAGARVADPLGEGTIVDDDGSAWAQLLAAARRIGAVLTRA